MNEDPMVRHEAGEALAAIGDSNVSAVLRKFVNDPAREVAETCQLSLAKLKWLNGSENVLFKDNNPYQSVDPAPPYREGGVAEWREELNDTSKPLFSRYRALFSLRNIGGAEAVSTIVSGFQDSSVLFKHEIAYVLGQMQDPSAIPGLVDRLEDLKEGAMVRHECAEALGSIASEQCLEVLQRFLGDGERVVRESCEVALDMYRFERGEEFQYANTASKVV
jgi:deoxyhypusine monooxygenase